MERTAIGPTEYFDAVMAVMRSRGLLLAATDPRGRANAMTIGWGAMGGVWSMPVWIVLVRPSRYTYACIEHGGAFTVNVPAADMAGACEVCGTRSGRDGDKLAEAHLTPAPAGNVAAPVLDECPIVYECEVVHRNDVRPEMLVKELAEGPYAGGDYHRVYFGRIVAASAAGDAASRL